MPERNDKKFHDGDPSGSPEQVLIESAPSLTEDLARFLAKVALADRKESRLALEMTDELEFDGQVSASTTRQHEAAVARLAQLREMMRAA